MDKQIKSYAQLYSGNWNHGGLLRSWPDDIAGSTTASRSKGHRLFLRQALHSSLSVILDERMFYVGSDDEEGEDSSSEVFAGPEGSSPDKHEPPQPPGPRRPYQQLPQKQRSHSGSDPPVLKKLPSRTHSVHGDSSTSVRSRSCGSSIGGSGSSMKGSVASAGTRSRVVNGLESLHKNESFPKSSKRRNLSSSSLPGGLVSATSLSASASVDYGDCCDREGGGESGYGGSEVSGCTHSGVSGSGVLSSSSPSSSSLSPASLTRGFQVRTSPRGQQDGRGTPLARSASVSSGHVRCASSPSSFCLTSPPPPLPPPPPEVATASRLQDLDIVGESFESRFPWQRDVAVQCNLSLYTHRRARLDAVSTTSSSGGELLVSSVDFASNNNSNNPHNQTSVATTGSSSSNSSHLHHQHTRLHHPGLSGHSNSLHGVSSTDSSLPGVTRRANFMKRPRPSSLGALENARYQSELSRFRDLVTRRGERKSDPQVMMTSPGWRRVPLGLQEDVDSVSDLESILEYPDECPSDLSRQTSFASFDAEDDIMRHYDGYVADMAESADYSRSPTDVLHSPNVSPPLWAAFDDGDMSDSDESEYVLMNGLPAGEHHSLRFRRTKPPRRLSSGSLTSGSENEAEHEPSPPVARRGRRSAIYETKNCGDVSPTTLSPEHSPSNSCDEGEGASNIAERLRRRRSSVDLAMNIYPGDLLVQEHHKKLIKRNTIADFYAGRSPSEGPGVPPSDGTDVSKKGRQPFSLLKLMKTRSKENLTRLDDILRRLKPSEFKDNHLAAYKNVHWSDLIASTDKQNPPITISDTERKRREAVWELFKSECVFLIDHCMVLKHCFMEPLKKVQVEGSLMFAEPQDIFGNLDELCYVSYTFCKDFIAALLKDMSVTDFGRTKVLIKAFQRFSTHSKDGAVFHTYCINYTNALAYLDKLRQNSEFAEFERWCEQDPRCNRLQLTDLLVAPMQHCTKLPLLLANIRKYTESEIERQMVTESIEKVETSLQQLEEKMKWIKNVERVQEIQRQIIWPPVAELDPRCVIPDCLKSTLAKQPCERMLSCTKRQLLHEGPLTLMESPKPIDVHVFLFDDLLLITKIKKTARKKQGSDLGAKSPSGGTADRASYVVFRQPLAMDRFTLHDIAPADASASGLKNVMVLVHISRFQQVLGLFTLQAASDAAKVTWLNQIREAKERYAERETSRQNSFKENKDPRGDERDPRADSSLSRSPRRVKRNSLQRKGPSKSRSMDAVFI